VIHATAGRTCRNPITGADARTAGLTAVGLWSGRRRAMVRPPSGWRAPLNRGPVKDRAAAGRGPLPARAARDQQAKPGARGAKQRTPRRVRQRTPASEAAEACQPWRRRPPSGARSGRPDRAAAGRPESPRPGLPSRLPPFTADSRNCVPHFPAGGNSYPVIQCSTAGFPAGRLRVPALPVLLLTALATLAPS